MNVKFLSPARREPREAVKYYEKQRTGLGKDFRDEVQSTIERIIAFPLGWSLLNSEVRRCQTKQFPYGIIYAIENDAIIIIAVAHLHRESEYWKDRI